MTVLDAVRARYSVRSYQKVPVEPEKLERVLEAGRLAPSACNNHPTRVLVLTDPEDLKKAAAAQPRFARDGSIFGAPVLLVACGITGDAWTRRQDQMNSAQIDSAIVVDHMMLEAVEQGLGTCWVCAFDPEVVERSFDLPAGTRPISILAVGYAADEPADEERREARRIPMGQFLSLDGAE